ncbi:MAG: hypothetical protein ACI8RD_002080 [Bacillariaceae sp.]|jgi:hypothetical protein
MNKYNIKGDGAIRTGKYNKEETETVKRAVENYCSMKQITVARLCSECDHKAELKGAWMEIAKELPHRSVQSVYRHGLRQLHPFKRGTWSDEEVESLITSVTQYGKKWATIQTKLNRSADSCRDKYREIDDSYIRGRWKENETEQLKRLIREHLRSDPRADIKELGKMVESQHIKIPWSTISKRMGKRSRLSCFKKWQKMTGLFSASDLSSFQKQQQLLHNNSTTTTTGAAAVGAATTTTTHLQKLVADADIMNQQHHSGIHHQQVATHLRSNHDAPTAGAAAANAMAMGLAGGRGGGRAKIAAEEEADDDNVVGGGEHDMDVYLLSEIISLGVHLAGDVGWTELRSDNAEDRWFELLDEWQLSLTDDSLLALPVSEIAQLILDRKTSAQRAAETVEAVDLPPVPESLQV